MKQKQPYAFSVSVKTQYLADQSNPDEARYAFAYTVTITNIGSVAAQLISRHWIITNENQETHEVKGLGVIGAQPLLEPDQQFEYTSGTVFTTANGEMRGSYQLVAADGTWFEANIEPFVLKQPRTLH
ncbi:MAG TPA: Co2+/Mg2+ efflux protein ApaG [Methylophilaceae bacterium]|nr:Co2+/Mg2+ efflux protein ApaG [Methylophilaceae bacterium]HAJ71161.1 Co2+/Mg2+ efflux protein ApaG [Methylophilaceae bacterium]